jgi:hypothetical protein
MAAIHAIGTMRIDFFLKMACQMPVKPFKITKEGRIPRESQRKRSSSLIKFFTPSDGVSLSCVTYAMD